MEKIKNDDCMNIMPFMGKDSVQLTLTDIPYGEVNRNSNGLRNLNKDKADILNFDLEKFLEYVYLVTKGTIIIFCGKEQLSPIYSFFNAKQKLKKGTVRQLIWQKSNPSPMNGEYIYLSGIENAVWFKKKGGIFNARCKNSVFKFPNGSSKMHPTEKNHNLLKELIIENSNENDLVFDPCAGSGSHLLCAKQVNRKYLGIELDEYYYNIAKERLNYN